MELQFLELVGLIPWMTANDRQKGTPFSIYFEQVGLRSIWMLDVLVWSYRRRFLPKAIWFCSTAATCRFL
jgi:hypothetical protein